MVGLCSRLAAGTLGTVLLLAIVIGSDTMAERLAGDSAAMALLANTVATVDGLYVLIKMSGPIGGMHFNSAIHAVMMTRTELSGSVPVPCIVAQLVGVVLGTWLTYAMFDVMILQLPTRVHGGSGQWVAEAVATAGLLLVTLHAPNGRASSTIAAYISVAYWFTASTSFANPAITFGRMFSNSFIGIAPSSVPDFILAECTGAVFELMLRRMLGPRLIRRGYPNVIEPSGERSTD